MSEVRTYQNLKLNGREIARYAHCDFTQWKEQIGQSVADALPVLSGRVCFQIFPLVFRPDTIDLRFTNTASADLRKCLHGCDRVVLFAATVGVGIDRLIQKYSRLSPSKALLLQAVGTEAVETVCNRFCEDLTAEYKDLSPRFSPGYGDLPLTLQTEIFRTLSCERQIGVTLNDSLLMSPSKSVTALVGIKEQIPLRI